jgi:hypothetical protein
LAVPLPGVYSTYGRPPESGIEKFMILLLQSKGEGREKANAPLPTRFLTRSRNETGNLVFDAEARSRGEKMQRRTKQVKT